VCFLEPQQRREYCPEGECGVDWEPELPTAGALITGERPALADVGTWLKKTLKQRFAQSDGEQPNQNQLSIKYIDPVRAHMDTLHMVETSHARPDLCV
jgi:hypothetical protein